MLGDTVRAYGKTNLAYLSQVAATLPPDGFQQVIGELRSLLKSFEEDPRRIIASVGQYNWTEDDITKTLNLPADPHPRSAWDGDDLPYMIMFLKAHLAVVEEARLAGLYVLHARST